MTTNIYLNFNGQCEEALKFYEQLFGGSILTILRYEGSPAEQHASPDFKNKVLHARLTLGDATIFASDSPLGFYEDPQGFSVSVSVDSDAEAERIFAGLIEGGTVKMPMDETFFAHRFGMAKDKFGVPWIILHPKPMGG